MGAPGSLVESPVRLLVREAVAVPPQIAPICRKTSPLTPWPDIDRRNEITASPLQASLDELRVHPRR